MSRYGEGRKRVSSPTGSVVGEDAATGSKGEILSSPEAPSTTLDGDEPSKLSSTEGWTSRHPVVVGRPTPDFEPRFIGEEYRLTPYRPDTVVDGWSAGPFIFRGASVRGHLHRHNGAPRQDDFAAVYRAQSGRLIVAVADGVSAASQSHLGSTTAVRYATQWLAQSEADGPAEIDWPALIKSTAWALIEQAGPILGEEAVTAERAEEILATTLVCAVVDADESGGLLGSVAAVGDSGAWVLSSGEYRRVEGGKGADEGGISSSAVTGLPRVPNEVHPVSVRVRPGEVFLLGTDGFGDPLGSGGGEVGALFASALGLRVPSLTEFSHVLDFSRETFDDDRTLVAVWPNPDTIGDAAGVAS